MSSTQPLPRVVLPRSPRAASIVAASIVMKQTARMPKLELESLLRDTSDGAADWDALANAVEPPPSSIVFPLVKRKS